MKKIIFGIVMAAFIFSGCNKSISPYTCIEFDKSTQTAYIIVAEDINHDTWLNTSMYVLDSVNFSLNKNNFPKGEVLTIISFSSEEKARKKDTADMVGLYSYRFENKEQTIRFKK